MYVVLRKFSEEKEWTICAACDSEDEAKAQVASQIRSGRGARYYPAKNVYVAENGNHSWN